MKALGYYLTVLGGVLSHPGAFIAAIAFTIAWVIVQPESLDWHGGVTIATLFMTLFIQRATHRDTQALHAKVDELIHSNVYIPDVRLHCRCSQCGPHPRMSQPDWREHNAPGKP